MNRYSRQSVVAALIFGAAAGMVIGVGLPRSQAKPSGTATASDLAGRVGRLELRVNALEAQAAAMRSMPQDGSRHGFGGHGFNGPGDRGSGRPNNPPAPTLPLGR